MAIEVSSDRAICAKCGTGYGRRKGHFPVSYAILHKGIGYVPVCKSCIDKMYNGYLSQCNNPKDVVRQMCRKLDLYWNEKVFDNVSKKSTTRSVMSQYISKINSITYAGKSYDDTLSEEGTLWNFGHVPDDNTISGAQCAQKSNVLQNDVLETPEEIITFWGSGYSDEMYRELEKRRQYYMSKLPEDSELDIGMEAIIRQICSIELDINRDRAEGKPVDKNINTLNTLLGSANWKPIQKKDGADNAYTNPLGVWLYRYENERPLPKVDENLQDVNGLRKNIFTWMGHLCKMLSKKNGYSKLYDEEIARLRVEKPEYIDEDDETLMMDSFQENKRDSS